ncbi:hypothetical protein LEP48_00655 [Isoptericola sp. NEAU-Y5]|uniref:Alpha/beta hydrolase n=1 Tax=Isoptericola luteus TaxID=2879484 RepID=A0ABS7ZDL0_9MICO|nr:hypothetical protein [Isoptericola sp. NEAU-Y5]MCA5891860.1 hypothetical protein [Isoptericola sp. NEAU-Y5]
MTRLVLLHGRDLDGVDPRREEARWLGALNSALAGAGSSRRLADDDASFVFYGDTLAHLTGRLPGPPPPVVVEAGRPRVDALALEPVPDDELRFVLAVVRELLDGAGLGSERAGLGEGGAAARVAAEGLGSTLAEAVARALALLDRYVPGLSAAVVLLVVRDLYAYLHDDAVRDAVDAQVIAAVPADEPTVVVGHSLGSVVACSALAGRAAEESAGDRDVALLLTLGSPLGIRAVRDALRDGGRLTFPRGVRRWVNARDPRDLLALHDLTPDLFPVPAGSPGIEALRVDNRAPGHHAAAVRLADGTWAGYLADRGVGSLLGG